MKSPSNLFDTSVLIAFLTLVGYVCAFSYQLYATQYYGIPYEFIRITPELTFVSVFVTFVVLMVLYGLFDLFEDIGLFKDEYYGKQRILVFWIALFCIPFFVIESFKLAYSIILLTIFLLLLVEIIIPLIRGRKVKGWRNKRKVAKPTLDKAGETSELQQKSLSLFLSKYNLLPRELFILLIFMGLISTTAGLCSAKYRTKYYLVQEIPNTAIVASYGDFLYGVTYDPNTLVFEPSLKMFSKEDISSGVITLNLTKVGRLQQPTIIKEPGAGFF